MREPPNEEKLKRLRVAITEGLRVQRGGATTIPYVQVASEITDMGTRQNHVIFGRRGCGKSLLLHSSIAELPAGSKALYLNCEDFKKHSFPNVLIEVLDKVFDELERNLTGWFGRAKKSKTLITEIRKTLSEMKQADDRRVEKIKEQESDSASDKLRVKTATEGAPISIDYASSTAEKSSVEREYTRLEDKSRRLHEMLPGLKAQLRAFFEISSNVKYIFIQIDDFYHLRRIDQPFVIDFIHRLCKDLPLYFKIATLRHASVLYVEVKGQPNGAQERHDYQPVDVDFTFNNFVRTQNQVRKIFHEYAAHADMLPTELDQLFKGDGFTRLLLAGGGIPRDCLSLFLEALGNVQHSGDGRIGKDDVRQLSLSTFQHRIEELKNDSEHREHDRLLKGIYAIRQFCLDRKTSVFLVREKDLQENEGFRGLLFRLLDYRIIHSVGSAYSHKSSPGSYRGFIIDIGSYAHLRKLHNRITEIDLAAPSSKEAIRSMPILEVSELEKFLGNSKNIEDAITDEQTQDQDLQ